MKKWANFEAKLWLRRGLEEIYLPLQRLALEVAEAESKHIPYARAANEDGLFHLIPRFHHGLLDLLQYELPREHATTLRAAMRKARSFDPGPVRQAALRLAAFHPGPAGALARYTYYQALRLNAWVINWDDFGGLEASGAMRRLDESAEGVVRRMLEDARRDFPNDDPLDLLVACALGEIWKAFSSFRERGLPGNDVEAFEVAATFYGAARRMGAPEATIIRNALEETVGGEPLEDIRLAERHVLAFPSKAALQQRRHRLLTRCIERGELPSAHKMRVIDLFREQLSARGLE